MRASYVFQIACYYRIIRISGNRETFVVPCFKVDVIPLNGYIRVVKPFVDVPCICGKFERIKFVCVTRIIERMKIFHIKKIINYFYR